MKLRYLLPGALALTAVVGLQRASLGTGAPADQPAKEPAASFKNDVLPFLSKHCFACHGNGKKRAGLSLDQFTDDESVQKDRKLWENVLYMLRGGEMPPPERPRPAAAEVDAVLRSIDAVLANFDCAKVRNAGRVTLRRLNKVEYNNTIRDLVGVDFKPAANFPEDDVGYGFDNIGDVLSMSPLLLERYLAAAESVFEQAVVHIDPVKPVKNRLQGIRVSRGSGEVRPRGLGVLNSGGEMSVESYLEEGDYTIRVEAYAEQAGENVVQAALRVNREIVKEFEVKADEKSPVTLEAKVRIKAGTTRVGLALLNPFREGKADDPVRKQRLLFGRNFELDGPYNAPPPVIPESHKRLMTHKPELTPREAAREVLTRFATLAFRRPVKPEEVERLLKLYDKGEQEGGRFEDRVRLALCGALVSPHFLFRVELDPPDAKPQTAYPVSDYELASRLSYFLWSTMPDRELFDLAAKGRLRQELDAQVRRMLKDPKSSALTQNFGGQWLTLGKLAYVSPDPKTFPGFDEELRTAMARETELFFEAILREDRSVLDLLDANFSFVNERLAKHYGIDGVRDKEFRRVTLPSSRGGVLTHASVLTLTSHPTHTSPVLRGKWVLEQVLNTPPPPPPPDVPEITAEKRLTGSLRKVMEQHRENAVCASCHARMDPIGFAFENYDAVGRWRDQDGKFDIDPSGTLPNGRTFRGPAELKVILKEKKDLFGRCLAEKMLTYALGRGLEYYDRCAVDKILAALDKNDYRFSTLLLEVVRSEPFQLRTATGGKP